MRTDYGQRDHSHCWDQKTPACGMPNPHPTCCICTKKKTKDAEFDKQMESLKKLSEVIRKEDIKERKMRLDAWLSGELDTEDFYQYLRNGK